MQISALLLALAACGSASAASIRSGDDICYKVCPDGQYCARGTTTCRPPAAAECFDVLKATWVAECVPGFSCQNGKCDVAPAGQPANEAPAEAPVEEVTEAPEAPEVAETPKTEVPAETPEESETEEAAETPEEPESQVPAETPEEPEVEVPAEEPQDDEASEAPEEPEAEVPAEAPEDNVPETEEPTPEAPEDAQPESDDNTEVADGAAEQPTGAICYKLCPEGQFCARGTSTCRAPAVGSTECFNMATAMWVAQCDQDYKCSNGKCVLA